MRPSEAEPSSTVGGGASLEMGFGWSFYGFFALAAIWMALYFVWAVRRAARDRKHARR